MERKVLLLNASEEVLDVIPWQEGIKKLLLGKAKKPYNYDDEYEIRTSAGIFKLPSALVLVEYIHIPFKNASITKSNLLKRDEFRCGYCGRRLGVSTMTIDHILPESRGGQRKWKNVVAACRTCNNTKDNKTPREAGMKLIKEPFIPSRVLMILNIITPEQRKKWNRWIRAA